MPGLRGLYWSAPYLHDAGVAVGKDVETELSAPGTLLAGVRPDAGNSLRALLDRELRREVVAANREATELREVRVVGGGHTYWVDAPAGFSLREQAALVHYLLTIEP